MKGFVERFLPPFALFVYVLAATIGAFTGGMWAGLGIGLGTIAFLGVWIIDRKPTLPDKNLALMMLATLAVAACLNFNSSQPGISWKEWIRLVTVFVPLGFLLAPGMAPRLLHEKFFKIIPVAMAIGCLALGLELYLKAPMLHWLRGPNVLIAGYNRGLSHIVMLAFPLMAALWFSKNRWTLALFILVLLVPASFTESRTAKLALMLALPVILVAHIAPVLVRRALTLAPFATLGWPFAARWVFANHYDWLGHLPDSWRARMEIWDYMSYRIPERPLLGWGLGTSATLDYTQPDGALYVFTKMPAAHPHNVTTQLWVELGLPGLALGLFFAVLTLRKAASLDARIAPFALGAWTAAFCFALLAYNFWTDSLLAAFALTGLGFLMLEYRLRLSRSSTDAPEAR